MIPYVALLVFAEYTFYMQDPFNDDTQGWIIFGYWCALGVYNIVIVSIRMHMVCALGKVIKRNESYKGL